MGIEALKLQLSGGAGNTDPGASTGGAKSTLTVLFQSATGGASIPGVTTGDASGNALGNGTLTYTAASKTITWTAPGDTIPGTPVSINANGNYLIRGTGLTGGYILIAVVSANLSGATDYISTWTIAYQVQLFLPAVDKDTALAGATQYYLYYLDNTGATTIKSVKAQVMVDTPGLDTLSLARIATKNTTETQGQAAANTFYAVGVDATLGDLLTTDYWGIWIKRVIPAATVDGVVANTFTLKITTLT